jgi:UDPglucose 6-dehydrogenase
VWGLTFKADTDDLRDSPAMFIAQRLIDQGAVVQAYDPAAGERATAILPALDVRTDAYDAATGAQVIAVLTEWDEFRWLDFERVKGVVAQPAIVDTRNMLDPAAMRRRGFTYVGVGR